MNKNKIYFKFSISQLKSIFLNSLHIKISGYVLITYSIFVIIFGIAEYYEIKTHTQEIIDANLIIISRVIDSIVTSEFKEHYDLEYATKDLTNKYDSQSLVFTNDINKESDIKRLIGANESKNLPVLYRIYDKEGGVFYSADFTGNAHVSDLPLRYQTGFSNIKTEKDEWHTLITENIKGGYFIEVFQNNNIKHELDGEALENIAFQLKLMVLFFPLLIWVSIHRSLSKVRHASKEISERTPDNLEPIELSGIPNEIKPMVHSINSLMQQVTVAMDNTRQFTADASHELRNPLAAIRINIEAAKNESEPEERQKLILISIKAIDKLANIIEKLLLITRFDTLKILPAEAVNLKEYAVHFAQELYPMAKELNIEIEVKTEETDNTVNSNPEAVNVITRNLLENAIRYSNSESTVCISLTSTPNFIIMSVADEGPGIPADKRDKIFERFFRISSSTVPGSGLGLSIVKKLTELINAKIEITDNPQGKGTVFNVYFPRVT